MSSCLTVPGNGAWTINGGADRVSEDFPRVFREIEASLHARRRPSVAGGGRADGDLMLAAAGQ
jgi:hypothetical protein